MASIVDFMGSDHKRCDQSFAAAEQAVAEGDWTAARHSYQVFLGDMEHHFAMEEQALFPPFEHAAGHSNGPTAVMRMEHEQMRALFTTMAAAIESEDADQYLGDSETLLILMQQHNAKEESVLYPMCERLLPADEMVSRMAAIGS